MGCLTSCRISSTRGLLIERGAAAIFIWFEDLITIHYAGNASKGGGGYYRAT